MIAEHGNIITQGFASRNLQRNAKPRTSTDDQKTELISTFSVDAAVSVQLNCKHCTPYCVFLRFNGEARYIAELHSGSPSSVQSSLGRRSCIGCLPRKWTILRNRFPLSYLLRLVLSSQIFVVATLLIFCVVNHKQIQKCQLTILSSSR